MSKGIREDNIRRIVSLEERIMDCKRCKLLIRCTGKPALGKGELEPDIMLIFESNNSFINNKDYLIRIRNLIKMEFGCENVYNSFLLRCQPKACTLRQAIEPYSDRKLVDKDNNCLLNANKCVGIPIKASDEEIIFCLPFLLEEIEILQPQIIILFGKRVAQFVLKSYGIFENIETGVYFKNNNQIFLRTTEEIDFESKECQQISQYI